MHSTTYIRDLKKADRVTGDECLLIQDVESTKQAPLSVVIDKAVEKSTAGVAEAIDEFNTTANQQITDNQQQIDTFVEDAQARVDEALDKVQNIDNRFAQTDAQLFELANKGTTVEVLERVTKEEIDRQIADGTMANLTLADDSITSAKYKDNSISNSKILNIKPEKIDYIEHIKEKNYNLFVKTNIDTLGYWSPGDTFIPGEYVSTKLIEIKPSTKYITTDIHCHIYYDVNEERISGANTKPITSPINAKYIRLTFKAININDLMLVEGEVLPPYKEGVEKDVYKLKDNFTFDLNLKGDDIKGISLHKVATANLFNKNDIVLNGYYDGSNGWVDDTAYCSSGKIYVGPNERYISKTAVLICFYDINDAFISLVRTKSFITPINTHYLRLCLKLTQEEEMLYKGLSLPEEYEEYSPNDQYRISKEHFLVEMQDNSIDYSNFTNETKEIIEKNNYNQIQLFEQFERALPKVPLQIETYYDGANEPYHPSVVKFDNAWNGYKYWMAYTPFPNEANENPCICASNDLIKWETPSGLINPIDVPHDYAGTSASGYWSDTHLVYNSNINKLECWYRGIGATGVGENNICRKTTSNGITWSDREVLFTFSGGSYVSPSVIFEDNKYKIWFCRPNERYDSIDGTNWVKQNTGYSFFPTNYNFWHQDIVKTDIGYELVGMEGGSSNTRIIHFVSEDGEKFKEPTEIMKVLDNNRFGIKGFYKPCLLKNNGYYYLFSSLNFNNGLNGVSLSISNEKNNIKTLKGINQDYLPYMSKYTRKSKSGFEGQVIFDKTLNKMLYCKIGGRNAVWIDFNGNEV